MDIDTKSFNSISYIVCDFLFVLVEVLAETVVELLVEVLVETVNEVLVEVVAEVVVDVDEVDADVVDVELC